MGPLLLILVLGVECVSAQSTYTITAPNTIRIKTDYRVAVTNHGTSSNQPLKVNVQVLGQGFQQGNTNGRIYSSSGVITVAAKSTKILTLKIGDWEQGNYRLQCNGSGSATFMRTTYLNFNNKEFSILIQMDKAIYQRGQIVHFRVVCFNSNLLPYKNNTLFVYITDSDNNRIKQWNVPVPQSGVFENELQLSDQPVLGNWRLVAKIKEVTTTEDFEVAEYTLPKFDVVVKPPPYITQDDIQFPVKVTSLYTSGGQVTGTYLVNVTESYCTYTYSTCRSRPVVLEGNFKGTAEVIIKIGDLLIDKNTFYGGSLTILAVVTEEFTGIKRNSSTTVRMYENIQRLSVEQSNDFKPQAPHTFTVKLFQPNGDPVTLCPKGAVTITVTYSEGFSPVVISGEFGNDGTLSRTVVPPLDAQSLSVKVDYKNLTTTSYASLAQSLSDKFVSISVENKSPKVGDVLTVKVYATFKVDDPFSYQVVGRGNIQIAKTEVLTSPSNSFSFTLTRDMAPHVRIIGYYVTGCGEIVGDSLDVSVDGILRNPVTLQLSNTTREPGDNVTISISTKPDSIVYLLSVDQSVLLLKSGNDITNEEIVNELQGYDIGDNYYFPVYYGGIIRRPPFGSSFDQIFSFAGLTLITNALYYKASNCFRTFTFAKGGINDLALPGPMAKETGGSTGGMVQPTRTRKFFPEVWIWANTKTNNNGKVDMTYTVPDTITTWVISGLATSDKDGLGITDAPTNLTVSRSFFISVSLPRFIIRTEIVTIQILIFSSLNQELSQVIVTLNKTNDPAAYDFLEPTGSNPNILTKMIKIAANGVQVVTVRIRPLKVGYEYLDIKAVSALAGDQILQPLLVKAEGITKYVVNSAFVDLRNASVYASTIGITIPRNAVPNSQFIECAVMGDIMAPVIANIKELLRMPSGCGEQNMINLVPNVVILQYLKGIGQLSPDFEKTAISYMEIGYQTQLTYKRNDGSFSAFGKSDNNGSTWLTAYVLKFFNMGARYITIDSNVVLGCKTFLASRQATDGQFIEYGRVIHKAMQGGSASGLAMTAFVVIAFLEEKGQDNAQFSQVIQKAVKYLEDNLNAADNSYELAILAYALHLANSPKKNQVYTKLIAKKITEGDLSYWSYSVSTSSGTETSYNVETTAYAMLTLSIRPEISTSYLLPTLRWLVSKRSSLGGYDSSQDTVIGIQALGAVGPRFAAPKGSNVQMTLSYVGKSSVFNLTSENALVLQKVQIPNEATQVNVRATGNGVGIVQCAWNYNVVIKGINTTPSFRVNPVVKRPNDRTYSVDISVSALYNNTNMVLLEFDCLSGYDLDMDFLPRPGYVPNLTRVETSNGNTHVVFYFSQMATTPKSITFTITAVKSYDVDGLKDGTISVYDYYENSKRAEAAYNIPVTVG